jgi:phosphatidylserine decarboxylase
MSILKEGFPFILPPLVLGIALIVVSRFVNHPLAVIIPGSVLLIFAVFCIFFFRDPKIEITRGDGQILSPCNGTVLEVVENSDEKIIRVFLSIFNVHLQRSPVDGVVTGITHQNGKFLMAWDPQAHSLNEQNIFVIQSDDGAYTVRQIAGFLARRCVSWVKAGDTLKKGDKIGMIKFSSQVDLHLPSSSLILVKTGDKVRAGITVMGSK